MWRWLCYAGVYGIEGTDEFGILQMALSLVSEIRLIVYCKHGQKLRRGKKAGELEEKLGIVFDLTIE